jgi:hypothetical protein
MRLVCGGKSLLRINGFGLLGCVFYALLSMPFLRSLLFGEKAKVLDAFSGNVVLGNDIIKFLGQAVLIIPFYLNQYIFEFFNFNNFNLLVFLLFIPVVYCYFSFATKPSKFLTLLLLFSPAPLLFLSNFNKETIMVLFLFIAFGYDFNLNARVKSLYFYLYSLCMRPYLIWVPLVLKSKNMFRATGVMLLLFFTIVNFATTKELVFRLFNRRLAEKADTANSEIIQSVYVQDLGDIFNVLVEVVPQILMPFLLNPGFKNFIFQSYISFFLFLCIVHRNKYSNVMLCLILLYVVLDPDLGAFFRHITSFFIIFPLLLSYQVKKI